MATFTSTPSIESSRAPIANDVLTIPTAASAAGVSVKHYGSGIYRMAHIVLNSPLTITVTDTGGANGGYGSYQLADFPAGLINIVGGVTNLTFTAAAGIGATAALKHSVGTAAEATNDTLDSTQANAIPSTSVTLAASTGTVGGVSTAAAWVDGTTTAADLFLNIGVADAGISSSSSVTVTGQMWITYAVLGDK